MSRLRFNNVAAPTTPAAGKTELYVDSSDKRLATKDETGLVRKMLEEAAALYRLVKVTEIFQGTVSYTPTAGVDALFVECIGAGGSGAGVGASGATSQLSASPAGGGGAYSALFTTTIKTFTVQVGLGGPAPSAGANGGTAGTDTTFDSPSICTAKGGGAGPVGQILAGGTSISAGSTAAGGASASGIGDQKMDGGDGTRAVRLSGATGWGGDGGAAAMGGGIASGVTINSAAAGSAGAVGKNYGGGGSGCADTNNTARAGGAGANGLIRVWEFQAIT